MFSRLCATIRSRLFLQLLFIHLLQSEGFLWQERLGETIEEGHKVWLLYSKRGCVKTTVIFYTFYQRTGYVHKMPEANSAAILILTCLHTCFSKKIKNKTLIWSLRWSLPSSSSQWGSTPASKPSLGEKSPDACGGALSQVMTAPNDWKWFLFLFLYTFLLAQYHKLQLPLFSQ